MEKLNIPIDCAFNSLQIDMYISVDLFNISCDIKVQRAQSIQKILLQTSAVRHHVKQRKSRPGKHKSNNKK